jgi:hypothetical protein
VQRRDLLARGVLPSPMRHVAGHRCLSKRHKDRPTLVDFAKDRRMPGSTKTVIKLMLTPKVSQISAGTAHPMKSRATRRPVTK